MRSDPTRPRPRQPGLALRLPSFLRIVLEPRTEPGFGELSRRQRDEGSHCIRLGSFEAVAVQAQEDVAGHQGRALVAVDERMIPCEPVRIGRCEIEDGAAFRSTLTLTRNRIRSARR